MSGQFGKYIAVTTLSKADVLARMDECSSLELSRVYDFLCQFAPQPQGIGKLNFATLIDINCEYSPSYVSLAGASVYFLEDLTESDRSALLDLVRNADGMGAHARTDRLARKSGIVAPSAGGFGGGTRIG